MGNDRYLTASVFKNELVVHIREYDGGEYPTRKRTCFVKARWATFVKYLDEIDEAVRLLKDQKSVDYSQHLGGILYVTVSTGVKCINIRKFYLPPHCKKEMPTRTGISLRIGEWDTLLDKINELHQQFPELKTAKPCFAQDNHLSPSVYNKCAECNPFGVETYGLYNV